MMLNTIFLLYCMKLSHINHDEKIYTAVFLNFILTSRIKVLEVLKKYSHESVLEIGCGLEPIGKYMTDIE